MQIRNKKLLVADLAYASSYTQVALPKSDVVYCSKENIALVVCGEGVKATFPHKKTYGGRTFWLDNAETEALLKGKQFAETWGNCWLKAGYSAFENHGLPSFRYYAAEGLSVKKLLAAAGLEKGEIQNLTSLTFKSENGYSAVLEGLYNNRKHFYTEAGNLVDEVEPMLAYYRAMKTCDTAGAAITKQERFIYPTLMFGQKNRDDTNNCSFVKNVQKIILGRESEQAALQIFDSKRLYKTYTVADIIIMGAEKRLYKLNGQSLYCYGIDFADFLAKANIEPETEISFDIALEGCRYTCKQRLKTASIRRGQYLLTYYSEDAVTGRAIPNETELKLYMPNSVISNLVALNFNEHRALQLVPMPASKQKKPFASMAEVLASCFYICVKTDNSCLYYYFSLEELKENYPLINSKYNYNDHTVEKAVSCNGVMLTNLIESLVDSNGAALALPEAWQLQFVEEDAYHTNIKTYIDTIGEAAKLRYPILAYEIKESYAKPSKYNVDDEAYKKPESFFIYRTADSANEAVVKNIMGIVISENGNAFAEGGYTVVAKVKQNGSEVMCKTVKGAMQGMYVAVNAPELTAYKLAEAEKVKLVQAGEPAANTVEFVYEELPYLSIFTANRAFAKQLNISHFMEQACQIPNNLASVKKLVQTGEAVYVTDENCHPVTGELKVHEATRNLYIDRRKIAADTSPFGYGNLILYRYNGMFIDTLAGLLGTDNKKALLKNSVGHVWEVDLAADAAQNCFIAYMHSQSKGTPNNTSNRKRRQKLYEKPKLINAFNGEVLMEELTEIEFLNL